MARPEGVDQELRAAENSLSDGMKEWLQLDSTIVRLLEKRYGSQRGVGSARVRESSSGVSSSSPRGGTN